MLGITSLNRGHLIALGAVALVSRQIYKTFQLGKTRIYKNVDAETDLRASPHASSTTRPDRNLNQDEDRLDQIIEDSFPASDPAPLH